MASLEASQTSQPTFPNCFTSFGPPLLLYFYGPRGPGGPPGDSAKRSGDNERLSLGRTLPLFDAKGHQLTIDLLNLEAPMN